MKTSPSPSSKQDRDQSRSPTPTESMKIVARVSTHALREERTYHICRNLIKNVDPEGQHIVKPIEITRLAGQQGDQGPIVVCIFEHPGPNYLPRVIDNGPAWYKGRKVGGVYTAWRDAFIPSETVPLQTFLDFAVGATECLVRHGPLSKACFFSRGSGAWELTRESIYGRLALETALKLPSCPLTIQSFNLLIRWAGDSTSRAAHSAWRDQGRCLPYEPGDQRRPPNQLWLGAQDI